MNYSDGYTLNISEELAQVSATVRNLETRERIIYEYDYKNEKFGREVFRVRVVSKTSYDSGIYNEGYVLLATGETQVWLAKLSDDAAEFELDEKKIKEMFTLIGG
jgi:hypothetical protein